MKKGLFIKLMECFPLESIKEDFNKLIYNRTYLKAMEYRFIVGDNFGLAGSMGTGKTSILNYLEEKIRAKNMGVCIRINSSLCNEDIFFRLLLFELLKNNIVKKI
jgi:ABC-type multidrug transport system ATPase subunit